MNSEELRLLGETYVKITESQIVTEDDERSPEVNAAKQEAAKRKAEQERQSRQTPITAGGGAPEEDGQVERYREMARERARKREMQNNSVDLFDIVKGHLMSEGYANTEESALAIMANMSEEWRQSIIEQFNSKWEAHYGLVGVPKKAIDAIPGVRALRTAASNTLHRMNYPGVKPVTVGDKVVPYEYINPGAFAGLRNRGMKPAGRVTNLETGDSKSSRQIGKEMTRND